MNIFKQVMVLFLASFFLAGVNFFINPKRVPWDPSQLNEGEVNLASAMKIAAQSEVVWVDARGQADFELGHIPGALLLNEDDWDTLLFQFLDNWNGSSKIIVYCSSDGCQASHFVAARLRDELDFDDVWVLHDGWSAWKDAKQ